MEVFVISIVFFVVAPIIIIMKNENMTKFVQQRIISSVCFRCVGVKNLMEKSLTVL
jgi:hypothetical protein